MIFNAISRYGDRFMINNNSMIPGYVNKCTISIGVFASVMLISGLADASDTVPMPPEPAPAEWFDAEQKASEAELNRLRQRTSILLAPTAADIGLAPPAAPAVTGGTWIAQGPAATQNGQTEGVVPNNEVIGAIHTVVAHPTDADRLWIGSTNGGVWRTTNATAASPAWEPLTDNFPGLSIGALEADPADPNTLVAGIGRYSSFGGIGDTRTGLLLTTDGGTNWTAIDDPLLVGQNISGVVIQGGLIMASSNFNSGGIFRRANAAASWVQISGALGTGLPSGAVFDLVGDPGNNNRFYASVSGNGIFMSTDAGATWNNISSGDATLSGTITGGGNNNTEMAVAAGRIYVGVIITGQVQYIGFSDNQGNTWTAMDLPQILVGGAITGIQPRAKPGGQGGTHFSIRVDPGNNSTVYVGGDRQARPPAPGGWPNAIGANDFSGNLYRGDTTIAPTGAVPSPQWEHLTHSNAIPATPGGGTANSSAPHADSREIVFDMGGNMIEVDDGGIYRRTNPDDNTGDWFSLNGNLQVTEFHDIAYDTNANIIFGGAQDTGTHEQNSTGGSTYTDILTADGGDVAVDDTSIPGFSTRLYSTQTLNNFRRRDCDVANTCVTSNITPNVVGNPLITTFVTPLELNVTDQSRLIIGGANSVYESPDYGANITEITGPGGDPIGGPGGQNAMIYGHPDNADLIYVGSNTQLFVRTALGGNLVATPGVFPGGTIRDIAVDPADENIVYAIDSDQVFRTMDGGASWDEITGNIGDGNAANYRTILYIEGAKDLIAVGTDAGILASQDPKFDRWFILGEGLPDVIVYDLDYDAADDILLAGTLGRGAWTLENPADISLPVITLPVTELDFGTVCGPVTETLEVCNTGMADLRVDSVTSSDPQFLVTEPSSGFPVIISPDFCFPFEVMFSPASIGPQSGILEITSNDPTEPVVEVDVLGTLGAPNLNVAIANSGDFGATCAGDQTDLNLTLFNQGQCNLTINNITSNEALFELPADLQLPLVLSPDADFNLPIRYAPEVCSDVAVDGTITINSDSPGEETQEIDISGISPCPNLVIDPPALEGIHAFPATVVDTSGALGCFAEETTNLRNNGGCPLTITDINASGPDYAVTQPSQFPIILPPGEETLGVTVMFTPQDGGGPLIPGEILGTLTVMSDDPDGDALADLCGEGVVQSGVRLLTTDITSGIALPVDPVDEIRIRSKGKNTPSPINLRFTDQSVSMTSVCGNDVQYHVNLETLPAVQTSGSNPKSSYIASAKHGNLQDEQSFNLGQCDFLEFQLQLKDSDGPVCLLSPKGASCSLDSECCSGKCKGPSGGKSCK